MSIRRECQNCKFWGGEKLLLKGKPSNLFRECLKAAKKKFKEFTYYESACDLKDGFEPKEDYFLENGCYPDNGEKFNCDVCSWSDDCPHELDQEGKNEQDSGTDRVGM